MFINTPVRVCKMVYNNNMYNIQHMNGNTMKYFLVHGLITASLQDDGLRVPSTFSKSPIPSSRNKITIQNE